MALADRHVHDDRTLRDVGADTFAGSLNDGLKANHSEQQLAGFKTQIETLNANMKSVGEAKKGDQINFEFVPEAGTRIIVNGQPRGAAIPGEDFFQAVDRLRSGSSITCNKEWKMADEQLKRKIHDVLKRGFFRDADDLADVSDGDEDNIHVVIVSRKFDRRRTKEKEEVIWSELTTSLAPEEWGKVSLSVGASPEEIKAT